MNYNKPLPPIRISDLNERTFLNERDTENPEIRDMFKALGIIESFGTGIGEAKRSMRENGSPDLFYKTFDVLDMADEMLGRDIFTPDHYVFYQKDGGYHDFNAVTEYLYNALPLFFTEG